METTSLVTPSPPEPPPDEHHSRAPEFYGFVAWTSTSIVFVLYVLWALLPDDYIVWLGVEWYPSREWALLLPAYSIVIVLLTYFVYFAIAIARTPAFSDPSTFIDNKAHLPAPGADQDFKHADPDAIPELYDIPIGLVNRVLYGPCRSQNEKRPPQERSSNGGKIQLSSKTP
ncbi:PIG-P-domain-containing protein [Suillus clintonianus]|uniref:PIG-P-domain-containing protein n=1 Tax=Suillus clintonianus TaxID=1904413 RepID=UPI001B8653B9|nr:PIG-P-domain-containing protein [Suillus clintonianus]KAG2143029.1 PIG-P-domain-containing protein [Suillus clintonianus]